MKKLSFVFAALFLLIVTACKTVPSGTIVKAPELLEKNKNFYISIPTDVDPDLVKYLIKNNVEPEAVHQDRAVLLFSHKQERCAP